MNSDAKARLKAALKAARDVAGEAEEQGRDLSGEEMTKVKRYIDEARSAKNELGAGSRQDVLNMMAELGDVGVASEKVSDEHRLELKDGQSVGDAFCESQQFRELQSKLPASPSARAKMHIDMPGVQFKSLVTGDSATSTNAGVFLLPDRKPGVEPLGRVPLTMRSLVTRGSTTADTIEYVRELTNTNNAAFVPEATTSAMPTVPAGTGAGPLVLPAGGGYKPEGGFTFEVISTRVKNLAEWMPVTNRALSDVGLIRTLIDQKLRADLNDVEDYQLLNGTGAGEDLTGILQVAGTQLHNSAATVLNGAGIPVGLSYIEGIKRAKTKVRVVGRSTANGLVMNPMDYEEVYLARVQKNPQEPGVSGTDQAMAGMTVVESENIPAGTALVGDFTKSILLDREAVSVAVTNSHADFFIRNLVAILAEQREAFIVVRPSAFCRVDLAAVAA